MLLCADPVLPITYQGQIQGSSSYANDEFEFASSEIKKQAKRLFKRSLQVLSDNFGDSTTDQKRNNWPHVSFLKTTKEIIFPRRILRGNVSVFTNTLFWNMSFEGIYWSSKVIHTECLNYVRVRSIRNIISILWIKLEEDLILHFSTVNREAKT